MRFLLTALTFLALFGVVFAWTKEDYEIFDLAAEIEKHEGKGTTFYSWLGVPNTATKQEIARAYRGKSIKLHPDKNPGVKGAHERFARLSVVSSILRDEEKRARYDFFYKNGFPRWKGTGYYYARFRPGLGTVLVFLTILTSALQYVVQRLNYKRDLGRIEHIIREARLAAWGQKMIPLEGQRKVKVNLGGPVKVDEDGNVFAGRLIEMIVEKGKVYMVDDGELNLIDPSLATPPSILRTWFLALLTSLPEKFLKRDKRDAENTHTPEADRDLSDADDAASTDGISSEAGSGSPTLKGGRVAAVKAGGRRRKAVRKR